MTVTSFPSSFDTKRYGPPVVKSVCGGFDATDGVAAVVSAGGTFLSPLQPIDTPIAIVAAIALRHMYALL
jgi:hypothetical protein